MTEMKDSIIEALREVYDPEIPINVYDLGLIYEITVKEGNNIHILMSLTSPACPTAEYIQEMIENAVRSVDGVETVEVELTFEPMWSPEMVSEAAREELGFEPSATENLAVQSVYGGDKKEVLKICFNCGTDSDKRPLLEAVNKHEKTYICTKCVSSFSS
jgi:FeS assembly SUF system protein